MRPPSLFCDLHAQTTRLAHKQHRVMDPHVESILVGLRGTWRPTIALQTIRNVGPVRHALAQRVACGTIEVHAPWADMLARGEEGR